MLPKVEKPQVYMLEACLNYGQCIRMQFTEKSAANEAREKISEAMKTGRYQTDAIVNVISDTCTYDIRASEVLSVSVVDTMGWNDLSLGIQAHADGIGLRTEPR